MLERYAPDDPREWINRANSSLVIAKKESEYVIVKKCKKMNKNNPLAPFNKGE